MIVTSTAAWEKVFSADVRIGFFAAANDLADKLAAGALPPDKAAVAPQLIFNQQLDACADAVLRHPAVGDHPRHAARLRRHLSGKPVPPLSEAPHDPTKLVEAWVRD